MFNPRRHAYVLALLIAACGAPEEINPLDGIACVGTIGTAPAAARSVEDAALLQEALGKSGEGKLCAGRVYEATQGITVYRVWNAAKDYTEFGRWWSLDRPTGTVARYREDNAICPEWSDLNQLTECKIKVGARFVMGPGQSASCMAMMYGKSAVNQIYMANDTRVNKLYVEGCTRLGMWP